MNKALLVEQMALLTKLPKATCKAALEGFIAVIGNALRKDNSVVLTGFGTFSVMKRKSRLGVNPITRVKMKIPSRKVPKFKAGRALKDMVA